MAGLPLSVFPGTYTPGAETSLHAAVDLINESWAQANSKTADFEAKIDAIVDPTTGWLAAVASPHVAAQTAVTVPTIAEPGVSIPATASVTDAMTLFDTKYLELVALLTTKFTDFRTAYFPNEQAGYALAETWLKDAINNPSVGMPVAVAAQLMTESTDRITADASRASDAVLASFAARRFPLPPGAAASAVLQIQQGAQDAVADASRKLTVQSIEMMKFAIEKTISARQIAMNSAVDYIKALASGPDMASRLINVGYDAQSKLISAASSFYGARTEAAKVISAVSQFNATTALTVAEKNQTADLTMIEDKLKALLAECQAFAQMATSLYNNLHASAGTGYNVSIT